MNFMGGHNKWSQIKRQKSAKDAVRSGLWNKLARRIAVESKKSGGDTAAAPLRAAIARARKENMPKESIERAVAAGISADGKALELVTYETYGPGGVAIVIETLTDNRNRTAQEIKHLISEKNLSLATPGSALWAFEKTAEGYIPKSTVSLSEHGRVQLIEILEAIGAHDDVENVYTNAA